MDALAAHEGVAGPERAGGAEAALPDAAATHVDGQAFGHIVELEAETSEVGEGQAVEVAQRLGRPAVDDRTVDAGDDARARRYPTGPDMLLDEEREDLVAGTAQNRIDGRVVRQPRRGAAAEEVLASKHDRSAGVLALDAPRELQGRRLAARIHREADDRGVAAQDPLEGIVDHLGVVLEGPLHEAGVVPIVELLPIPEALVAVRSPARELRVKIHDHGLDAARAQAARDLGQAQGRVHGPPDRALHEGRAGHLRRFSRSRISRSVSSQATWNSLERQ